MKVEMDESMNEMIQQEKRREESNMLAGLSGWFLCTLPLIFGLVELCRKNWNSYEYVDDIDLDNIILFFCFLIFENIISDTWMRRDHFVDVGFSIIPLPPYSCPSSISHCFPARLQHLRSRCSLRKANQTATYLPFLT